MNNTHHDSASREKTSMPFGTWHSHLSTDMVAKSTPRIAESTAHEGRVFWLQSVPEEQGRMTIMQSEGNDVISILPPPFSARSSVHEYGGGAFCLGDEHIFFVDASNQQLHSLGITQGLESTLDPQDTLVNKITDVTEARFADLHWDPRRKHIIAVQEDHSGHGEVINRIVTISLSGHITTLAEGADFYAYPRLNKEREKLCWIQWVHPNMPWDHTELYVADLSAGGELSGTRHIAMSRQENIRRSIVQPLWTEQGDLLFISDINNWWNIYKCERQRLDNDQGVFDDETTRVTELSAEFATPLWTLGMQNYAVFDTDTLLVSYTENGLWHLAKIDINTSEIKHIARYASISSVSIHNDNACFVASTQHHAPEVYLYSLDSKAPAPQPMPNEENNANTDSISTAESICFPTSGDDLAHGYYYPPKNTQYHRDGPAPLIALCHGGPTGQTDSSLNPKIQFWTQRGFAVVDVNYRGSTGYGRAYRQALYGEWGVLDVDDMVAAATYLFQRGDADPDKTVIKGGSSGGYTVLATLAFRNHFKAGVSLYGIGDLSLLASDTHKFEARYMDQLIGKYPDAIDLYKSRSPIDHVDQIDSPVLLFQGLQDKVVPPSQARKMKERLSQKGLPVALVEYEQEGHGFRQAENIIHMMNAELYFYQTVFNLGDTVKLTEKPIDITNL